jgi:hypothetical protein
MGIELFAAAANRRRLWPEKRDKIRHTTLLFSRRIEEVYTTD